MKNQPSKGTTYVHITEIEAPKHSQIFQHSYAYNYPYRPPIPIITRPSARSKSNNMSLQLSSKDSH